MNKFLIGLGFLLFGTINVNARIAVQAPPSHAMPIPEKMKASPKPTKSQAASPYEIPSAAEAVTFVEMLVNKGMEVANKPGDHQQEFGELLRDNFITEEISKFVLGAKWRQMTPQQRESFHQIYQKRLVQIYSSPEKVNTFKNTVPNISKDATSQTDGSVLVKSTFSNRDGSGEPAKVDWIVVKMNGHLYILNVMFEGISKLITERNDYAAIWSQQGNNPEKFIAYLQSTLKT